MISHHNEPNMCYVQLLNKDCKSHPKVVNHCQINDLNRSSPPSESLESDPKDDNISVVPSFLARKTNRSNNTFFANPLLPHHYNTKSKCKAAATGRQVVVETQVTHL